MATGTILQTITIEAGDIITKKRNQLGYGLLHFYQAKVGWDSRMWRIG
jgi:hypothetical protein